MLNMREESLQHWVYLTDTDKIFIKLLKRKRLFKQVQQLISWNTRRVKILTSSERKLEEEDVSRRIKHGNKINYKSKVQLRL